MLKGDKKKAYQKEYMRKRRSNKGSNKIGEGLTEILETLPKKVVTPVEKPTLFGSSWEAQEARDRILSGYGKRV
jgi:hypothetical protein